MKKVKVPTTTRTRVLFNTGTKIEQPKKGRYSYNRLTAKKEMRKYKYF
ncbi:MAG: hypothetical protein PHN69_08120 [Candidatus Pacebacteria bacterium]|nr:hypothetical protein [Candidatus Paceibacterota bacterium]